MTKKTLLLLLLLLLPLPALAETAEDFIPRISEFDQAIDKAETLEELYPMLASSSVTELKSWNEAQRTKLFKIMKMAIAMGEPAEELTVKESKIGDQQASLVLTTKEESSGGMTMTMTRQAAFLKEGGVWKTDLGEHLAKMKEGF